MQFLSDIFQYTFLSNALIAALLASISCGLIGTYIVARRTVFISGGITHASLGGIGIAYYMGINPLLGAVVFSVLTALGIEFFTKKADVREDSAIAILWSLGMAIGIIFIFLTPGYTPNLATFLFGSILTVSYEDIFWLTIVTILAVVVFFVFFRIFLYVAFDEEFAQTRRLPVMLINYLTATLTALTIVVNIRVMGITLVMSLLTLPAATANILYKKLQNIMLLSVVWAFSATFFGLFLSYRLNVPSGATIIFVLTIQFVLVKLGRWMWQKKAKQ